jgi:hypothetical protein
MQIYQIAYAPGSSSRIAMDVMVASFILLMQMLLLQTSQTRIQVTT